MADPSLHGSTGIIEGTAGYPADFLPAMVVYAIATDSSRYYWTETPGYGAPNNVPDAEIDAWSLVGVPPGDYYVYEEPRSSALWHTSAGSLHFGAAYTRASLYGYWIGCGDSSLISVQVSANARTSGVDPNDWYEGPQPFRAIPAAPPWPWATDSSFTAAPTQPFPDPVSAAKALFSDSTAWVASRTACQPNLACSWPTGEIDGHAAAYVTSEVGTNDLFRACTTYVYQTGSEWHVYAMNCWNLATAYPAIGSTGQVGVWRKGEQNPACVNFHVTPGLTAKVATCKPVGTAVTIDAGPYYLSEPTGDPPDPSLNYWWHAAGLGWVVDHYLQ